ncbi:OpgD/OpgG family glucan biosynthesis protein [Frateuria aurantia]
MQRRDLLKASTLLAAFTGLPALRWLAVSEAQAATPDAGRPFRFDELIATSRRLASEPYRDSSEALPPTLAQMQPQAFNAIHYDPAQSLWHGLDRGLDVEFFHVGMGFRQPVRMYRIDPASQTAREVHFDPHLFSYADSGVDTRQLTGDYGFAGFRIYPQASRQHNDIVAFLGASYFRAVDSTGQYGLSARGLAIDTFGPGPEEFPNFTAFWFEEPVAGRSRMVVYALLDSPSASGAYRFDIDCEHGQVVMDIDAHLHARKDIHQIGICPMTSMYSCGTDDRATCDTFHPQIHDSDRLSMWRGNGEWICRPLSNPPKVQFNSFTDENPRGFGLVQTDHRFDSYQDTVDRYDRRPSLWAAPTTAWGEGAINLMELPTTGETLDNVVAFWTPKEPLRAGQARHFGYRLTWSALPPVAPSLARVGATRSGLGDFTEGWAPGEHYPSQWARRFAIDFVGGPLAALPATAAIEPVIIAGRGQIRDPQVLALPSEEAGFRVLFDWYPEGDSTDPVNMRCYIRSGADQATLSETWLYQYFPPPANQRRHA